MIYTTNAVEALHRSLRKIIKTRGSSASTFRGATRCIDTIGTGPTVLKSQPPISRLGLSADNPLRLHI
jgi:hypothetical protein